MREFNLWLRGGLGAQLFQYSFGRLLAKEHEAELSIRTGLLPSSSDLKSGYKRWPEQISSFNHFGELVEDSAAPADGKTNLKSKWLTLIRALSDLNPSLLAHLGFIGGDNYFDWGSFGKVPVRANSTLNGLFVDHQLLAADRELLRSEIFDIRSPHENLSIEASANAGKVGIHMRLGDFLTLHPNLLQRYKTFYSSAVDRVLRIHPEAEFLVFSDDAEMASKLLKQFCGSHLNFNVIQDSNLRPVETLYLMASCSGLIAAKSTFAWWAGFLMEQSDAFVIFESPWARNLRFTPEHKIYPDAWQLLPV